MRFLGKTLLIFTLLHSVFQGQICLLLQVFLDFLLLHPSPLEYYLFLGAPELLQMVTAAMKLKDVYFLEEKL